jgi:hypothetical protein
MSEKEATPEEAARVAVPEREAEPLGVVGMAEVQLLSEKAVRVMGAEETTVLF